MGMVSDTHPDYHFHQLFSEPSDFLYNGCARWRTWVIGTHNELTTCLIDPFALLEKIKAVLNESQEPSIIKDYLVASQPEILMEAQDLAQKRGIPFRPGRLDLEYLLLTREYQAMCQLNCRFREQYGKSPSEEGGLVYYLGDNPSFSASWSARSQKIPTFRVGAKSALYWLPKQKRWLTCKEKLVAMGWPCLPEIGRSLGTPLFGATDPKRASDLLGNGMHFQSSGIFQLIALSCFGPFK